MDNEKIRRILRYLARDTRTTLREMAERKGVDFNEDMDDSEVLKQLLNITGVDQVFTELGANEVIERLQYVMAE